ncbi:MAG: hypothetical protein IPM36_05075 [Lewinellaceae bacterium]|nr:hypothetical protein [Lewinellaceae bacterium]
MTKFICFLAVMLLCQQATAQTPVQYNSLDQKNPIHFLGHSIVYQNDTIPLGPKAFFLDGQLTDAQAAQYPYVFNSLQSAAAKLTDGDEVQPMTLYLAPWVYWIDDPDDPVIRTPEDGDRAPYGMKIHCAWLRFFGLNPNPENVVLACNRGQTIGAKGNFTMFRFSGDGTSAENLTFGNYCNVDLEFPLKPVLNRAKRASAIVQAQLIHCDGDKIVARNTRFISRLNLCPFVGGKRVLFDRCHFESTDDALCGTGVYLNSTFDFYSSKPFYITRGTGAVLLNCDIHAITRNAQYFTKAGGQLAVVDCRIQADDDNLYIGWKDLPPPHTRNYQFGNRINGRPLSIGTNDPECTVEMAGKSILDAYRIEENGNVLYNTYNLLKGRDDWDPLHIKTRVLRAEQAQGKRFTGQPTQLLLSSTGSNLETGKDTATLSVRLFCFGNVEIQPETIHWALHTRPTTPGRRTSTEGDVAKLNILDGGLRCEVIPTNTGPEAREVIITASTPSGLEAAIMVTISPEMLPAPAFREPPRLSLSADGIVSLNYQLDTEFEDQSNITWYRYSDQTGNELIPVAVSRFNKPLKTYRLSAADGGHYLKAVIEPRHIRSLPGRGLNVNLPEPVGKSSVPADDRTLHPDFSILAIANQPRVLPGFWTWRQLDKPEQFEMSNAPWYYGEGRDGARGISGLLQGRSGYMSYTPVGNNYGDMDLTLVVAPFKSAGQGFSVAPLYMDVLLKFDAETMSGYGLRIERTTKYGNSVDFVFVRYQNGEVARIGEPVSTSCYRTNCTIRFSLKSGKLLARASTDAKYDVSAYPAAVRLFVDMELATPGNSAGGFGILYNGGAPTVIRDMRVAWE